MSDGADAKGLDATLATDAKMCRPRSCGDGAEMGIQTRNLRWRADS